jgi:hypothetical protein
MSESVQQALRINSMLLDERFVKAGILILMQQQIICLQTEILSFEICQVGLDLIRQQMQDLHHLQEHLSDKKHEQVQCYQMITSQ